MRSSLVALLVPAALATASCDVHSRVALVLDGDPDVLGRATTIELEALSGAQRARVHGERLALGGEGRLPREVPLEIPSDARVLRVRVVAEDASRRVVSSRLVTVDLEPGSSVAVRVRLEASCADVRCNAERDETCRAGACAASRPRRDEIVERPNDDTDLLALGQRLERRGEHDEAVRVYAAAIHKYHNNYEAAYRIGHIECFHRKDTVRCRRWGQRLLSLEPGAPRAVRLAAQEKVLAARDALAAGDLDRAARLVTEARRLDPANPDAPMIAGRIAEAAGRVTEAAESYRGALTIRPGWPAACGRLSALFARIGRPLTGAPARGCAAPSARPTGSVPGPR